MKTLQNDLTTIEQSKRLLELGVPKNSANHYYGKDGKIHYVDGTIPYSLLWETGCTSCWSVGRLIEIYCTCLECTWEYITNNPPIEDILCDIELYIGEMDFSKFEE
jgi:hypothetical protein